MCSSIPSPSQLCRLCPENVEDSNEHIFICKANQLTSKKVFEKFPSLNRFVREAVTETLAFMPMLAAAAGMVLQPIDENLMGNFVAASNAIRKTAHEIWTSRCTAIAALPEIQGCLTAPTEPPKGAKLPCDQCHENRNPRDCCKAVPSGKSKVKFATYAHILKCFRGAATNNFSTKKNQKTQTHKNTN
jgi:hypothetical protein